MGNHLIIPFGARQTEYCHEAWLTGDAWKQNPPCRPKIFANSLPDILQ